MAVIYGGNNVVETEVNFLETPGDVPEGGANIALPDVTENDSGVPPTSMGMKILALWS